jgi:hypothetical protein
MPSPRQLKGLALEEAAYRTFIGLLQQRMNTDGKEVHTDYGMVWVGYDTIFLFWNSQVPAHSNRDPYGEKILARRQADLVLCHRIWTKSAFRDSYDWTLLPIVAVELKNTNMKYRWPKAWLFDRDVSRRFLMTETAYVTKLLSMDKWEENARNPFPNATKILIQPAFGFTEKAERVPRSRKNLTKEERLALWEKQKAGLIPLSRSERDKILWRIKRLRLIVYQLGHDLLVGGRLPEDIEAKLSVALGRWLEQSLKRNFGRTELPQAIPLPAYYSQADSTALQRQRHNIWTYLMQHNSEFPQFKEPRRGYLVPTGRR